MRLGSKAADGLDLETNSVNGNHLFYIAFGALLKNLELRDGVPMYMCLQGGTGRIKSLKKSHPISQGKCTKSADKVVLRNNSMTRVEFFHWLPLMLDVREVGSHFPNVKPLFRL